MKSAGFGTEPAASGTAERRKELGMWDLIEGVINLIAGIWRTDCDLRDSSAMTAGSKFDRDSRSFVALLCGGAIALIVIGAFVWWYFRT